MCDSVVGFSCVIQTKLWVSKFCLFLNENFNSKNFAELGERDELDELDATTKTQVECFPTDHRLDDIDRFSLMNFFLEFIFCRSNDLSDDANKTTLTRRGSH